MFFQGTFSLRPEKPRAAVSSSAARGEVTSTCFKPTSFYRAAAKEFEFSYHNGDTYIYTYIHRIYSNSYGFPIYSNLN